MRLTNIIIIIAGIGALTLLTYSLGYERGKRESLSPVPTQPQSQVQIPPPTPSIPSLSVTPRPPTTINIPGINRSLFDFDDPFKEIKGKIPNFENSLKEKVSDDLIKIILKTIETEENLDIESHCKKQGIIKDYITYGSKAIDLNNDGIKEFIIAPVTLCGDFFRGASGNGPFYIFQKRRNVWKKIGDLGGNIYNIKSKKTDGYYDISTHWHLGAGFGTITYYKWDKIALSYKKAFSSEEGTNFDR